MPEHAYLVGSVPFLLLWLLFAIVLPQVRVLMVTTSFALGHAGPLLEKWYLRDYWSPEFIAFFHLGDMLISLEDYLFAFTVSGLAVGIVHLCGARAESNGMTLRGCVSLMLRLQLVLMLWLIGLAAAVDGFGLNSVDASVLLCILGGLWAIARNPAWWRSSVTGAAIGAIGFWLVYQIVILPIYPEFIDAWWHPHILAGIRVSGVPVEEMAWALAMVFFLGTVAPHCASLSAKTPCIDGLAVSQHSHCR